MHDEAVPIGVVAARSAIPIVTRSRLTIRATATAALPWEVRNALARRTRTSLRAARARLSARYSTRVDSERPTMKSGYFVGCASSCGGRSFCVISGDPQRTLRERTVASAATRNRSRFVAGAPAKQSE